MGREKQWITRKGNITNGLANVNRWRVRKELPVKWESITDGEDQAK